MARLVVIAAFIALPPPGPALAQRAETAVKLARYDAFITEAEQRFGLPASWIRAVIWQESRGHPLAVSPKGARGLMQIMPATWDGLRARYGLGPAPFDPRDNILAGTAYLREMHDRYGDVTAMLAAYNAGPTRVDDWQRSVRPLPRETRAYLAAILPQIGEGAAVAPSPDDPLAAPIFVRRSQSFDKAKTSGGQAGRRVSAPLQLRSAPATEAVPTPRSAIEPSPPSLFVRRSRRKPSR